MALWHASRASSRGPQGSREALAREGYDQHGAELYRFALSRLGDEDLAQDAVQETILRAWRFAERFDSGQGSLRTWLYAILRNVVHDQAAARRRHPAPASTMAEDQEGEPMMTDPMQAVADQDLVRRALQRVSQDHREAIVETYLRDRPYGEVAAELGVSVSTLRSRVFHGLKQLRLELRTMEAEG